MEYHSMTFMTACRLRSPDFMDHLLSSLSKLCQINTYSFFFSWATRIRTLKMTESESVALPFGDSPISYTQSLYCNCMNYYTRIMVLRQVLFLFFIHFLPTFSISHLSAPLSLADPQQVQGNILFPERFPPCPAAHLFP